MSYLPQALLVLPALPSEWTLNRTFLAREGWVTTLKIKCQRIIKETRDYNILGDSIPIRKGFHYFQACEGL